MDLDKALKTYSSIKDKVQWTNPSGMILDQSKLFWYVKAVALCEFHGYTLYIVLVRNKD